MDSPSAFELRGKFRNYLRSVVSHAKELPIRFIFITDIMSLFQIEKEFEDYLPPFELHNEINGQEWPRFTKEYVDVQPLMEKVENWSGKLYEYFNNPDAEYYIEDGRYKFVFADKYNSSIYYFSPFYQKLFPKLKKLIFMDTDMEFQKDPSELYKEFDKFSVDNIFACANDRAPHYRTMLDAVG